MKQLGHWTPHLVLGLLLLSLPLFAIYRNGSNALMGVLYGVNIEAEYPDTLDIHRLNVNYGVYDPDHKFSKSTGLAFDHYYYQWNHFDRGQFRKDMSYSKQKNRWPLITIEPYPFEASTNDQLFSEIQKGRYDSAMHQIYEAIKEFGNPVFLRWGHEMEKVTGRYPWASMDSIGFIESYRYFVNKLKPLRPNAYFVWSPIGNPELINYWPGADYVDYVGISVYSFSEWEMKNHGERRSFEKLFHEKYERIKKFDRPIIIAELGVDGHAKTRSNWLKNGFESFSKFPKLKSVVYFNAKDSKDAWGKEFSTPDWQIDSKFFNRKK